MNKKELDLTDKKILRILQDDGRISNLDLSKKLQSIIKFFIVFDFMM